MNTDLVLMPLTAVQCVLGARVAARFARGLGGGRIKPSDGDSRDQLTVIVPVLNERRRLGDCLEGLIRHDHQVAAILVVDSGSTDGTTDLVARYQARDSRVRLVLATPVPSGWNGKAWGLHIGVQAAHPATWLLTMDADVRPTPLLASSLLAHAQRAGLEVLSVATRQEIDGVGLGALHPSMLTTLVYRYGPPGRVSARPHDVQANGQCFLVSRRALEDVGGLSVVRDSVCEDVSLARALATAGKRVGFFEAGDLVSVQPYTDWREAWRNWPRSLPTRDRFVGMATLMTGLAEVALVQAMPLPLLALLLLCSSPRARLALAVNALLVIVRIGVLVGTRRAYRRVAWSYWLSPLCDLPVALQLWRCAFRRRHVWRGRVLVPERAA